MCLVEVVVQGPDVVHEAVYPVDSPLLHVENSHMRQLWHLLTYRKLGLGQLLSTHTRGNASVRCVVQTDNAGSPQCQTSISVLR